MENLLIIVGGTFLILLVIYVFQTMARGAKAHEKTREEHEVMKARVEKSIASTRRHMTSLD